MDQASRSEALRSITPEQANCLRLVRRDFGSKEIAAELDRSPHTVDGHLRKVIARLGARDRFEAARLFAEHEGRTQSLSGHPLSVEAPAALLNDGHAGTTDRVQEERLPFDVFGGTTIPIGPEQRNPLTGGMRVLVVLAGALVVALLAIAALPMSDAAQRLANIMDPVP